MISTDHITRNSQDEVDLLGFFRVLWDRRLLIGITGAVCGLVAVVLALTATPIYRGEVVVTEVIDQELSGAAGLAGQLGGLASLAGINLKAGNSGQKARAVLQSRRLVEEFIKRNALLPELFSGAKRPPTLWLAVRKFKTSVLSIKEDMRRGTITVAIDWRDPEQAARWANEFVALANELLRSSAIEESGRNIAYLNKQVANTNVLELQQVMYSLIERETKALMLASGRVEYAFATIDPAVTPEERVKPQRTLMVFTGLVLGGLLGILIAYARYAFGEAQRVSKNTAS